MGKDKRWILGCFRQRNHVVFRLVGLDPNETGEAKSSEAVDNPEAAVQVFLKPFMSANSFDLYA